MLKFKLLLDQTLSLLTDIYYTNNRKITQLER